MVIFKCLLILLLMLPFIWLVLFLFCSLYKYIYRVERRENKARRIAQEELQDIKDGKIDYFKQRYGDIDRKRK